MTPIFTLISPYPFIELPHGLVGWIGLIGLSAVTLFSLWKWNTLNKPFAKDQVRLFIFLMIFTPICNLFVGFRIPFGDILPPPGVLIEPIFPIVMVFASLPWVLAAGLLGPLSASAAAFFGGLFLSFWYTHNLFTAFELAFLAVLFSFCVRQRYRTPFFTLIRHPVAAAILVSFLFPITHLLVLIVTSQGKISSTSP